MYSYNSYFMFFIVIWSYKTVEKSGVGSSVRLVKYLQQNLFNNLLFLLAEMVLKVTHLMEKVQMYRCSINFEFPLHL